MATAFDRIHKSEDEMMGRCGMKIALFLEDPAWDVPFFKVLARNDTAESKGHQGGMVVPKELRDFFPKLEMGKLTPRAPTTDRRIRVTLFLGCRRIGQSLVRYQLQTWGGKRQPESRITEGLRPLRREAKADDVLIFQRRMDSLDEYRLILVQHGTGEYDEIEPQLEGRRWGVLGRDRLPLTGQDIELAGKEIIDLTKEPFRVFRSEVSRVEKREVRIARDAAFRELICSEYKFTCAVSGCAIVTPEGEHEVEAAHVVPVSLGGADDVRNGLALTRTLHWAFDQGLFGVTPKRHIFVPPKVLAMKTNCFLARFHDRPIREAAHHEMRVHDEALRWHFENKVKRWA